MRYSLLVKPKQTSKAKRSFLRVYRSDEVFPIGETNTTVQSKSSFLIKSKTQNNPQRGLKKGESPLFQRVSVSSAG